MWLLEQPTVTRDVDQRQEQVHAERGQCRRAGAEPQHQQQTGTDLQGGQAPPDQAPVVQHEIRDVRQQRQLGPGLAAGRVLVHLEVEDEASIVAVDEVAVGNRRCCDPRVGAQARDLSLQGFRAVPTLNR